MFYILDRNEYGGMCFTDCMWL